MSKNYTIIAYLFFTGLISYGQNNTFPPNGNVGIGTENPSSNLEVIGTIKSETGIFSEKIAIGYFPEMPEEFKLSVNGKVRAKEIKVYTGWADFVFYDNYKLPSLTDVENHIKMYGHLKDIPSAEDVKENGIELGEMNKLLLQKIEELTLYVIDLKKEVDHLNMLIDEK